MDDSILRDYLSVSAEQSQLYSPSELCDLINSKFNVPILPRTLLNYEQWGLISSPKRGGHGRGQGRWSSYEQSAAIEAYVAWLFLHGKYATPTTADLVGEQMPPVPSQTARLIKAAFEIFESNYRRFSPEEKSEFDPQAELWNQAFLAVEQAKKQSVHAEPFTPGLAATKNLSRALIDASKTLPHSSGQVFTKMALFMELDSLFPVTALLASHVLFWAQVTWAARRALTA